MRTLAEIEKAVPQLSMTELSELELFIREHRAKQANAEVVAARPWMELAGCLAGEAAELHRVDAVVKAEFEFIDP